MKKDGYGIGKKKNFKKKMNVDLWKKFIPLYKKYKIKFEWVKGHNGLKENERCDLLANLAAEKKDLMIDRGYEEVYSKDKLV